MSKGPAGYGRYDESPEVIGCPFARRDTSPCVARDGRLALDEDGTCAGCANDITFLVRDLIADYRPGREFIFTPDTALNADEFADLVREATEPA